MSNRDGIKIPSLKPRLLAKAEEMGAMSTIPRREVIIAAEDSIPSQEQSQEETRELQSTDQLESDTQVRHGQHIRRQSRQHLKYQQDEANESRPKKDEGFSEGSLIYKNEAASSSNNKREP
jgi:vesicle coat complex subunit